MQHIMTPLTSAGGAGAVCAAIYGSLHCLAVDGSANILDGSTLIPVTGFIAVAGGLFYAGTRFQRMTDKIETLEHRVTQVERRCEKEHAPK